VDAGFTAIPIVRSRDYSVRQDVHMVMSSYSAWMQEVRLINCHLRGSVSNVASSGMVKFPLPLPFDRY
jgi:hypothetical protein